MENDLLNRAIKMDRPAIEILFAQNYPMVARMALGLCGRADVGAGVVRFVIKRALNVLPGWKDSDAPQRWFLHHTILTARRAAKHQPTNGNDTLIRDSKTAPAEYVAFIRALRSLPIQQREAFILHHGEQLNERWSGVAMDCSVIAATNHLNAAAAQLQPIGGVSFGVFNAELARVYRSLSPPEQLIVPRLRRTIARHVWPRRIARVLGAAFLLVFVVGLIYAAIKIWPIVEF